MDCDIYYLILFNKLKAIYQTGVGIFYVKGCFNEQGANKHTSSYPLRDTKIQKFNTSKKNHLWMKLTTLIRAIIYFFLCLNWMLTIQDLNRSESLHSNNTIMLCIFCAKYCFRHTTEKRRIIWLGIKDLVKSRRGNDRE